MKKSLFAWACILILVLSGAGVFAAGQQDGSSKAAGKSMGITYYTSENPNLLAILKGAKERAEALGYKVYMADAQFDLAKQLADVENFIQLGVNVVLINPVDSAGVVPTVEALNRANIPAVMLDIDAKGGKRAALVTSDNEAMGRYGGEYIAWALKGKGKVAILDFPQLDIVKERSDNARKVFASFPDIKVVATELAVIRSQGLEKTENILQANPDLAAVYCVNDGGGLGAYFASKAAGRSDLVIASVDGDPEAVTLIKQGTNFKLDTAHHARVLGATTVDVANMVVQGKSVPYKTVVPVYPITNETVAGYPGWEGAELPAKDKLLPFWYNETSWKDLCDKYNYTEYRNTQSKIDAHLDLLNKLKAVR